MKNIFGIILAGLFSVAGAQADDQVTGTITFSGVLAPKAYEIKFAVEPCAYTATLSECVTDLDSTTFTGHVKNATATVGNMATGETNVRYVKFEAKAKMILFANDYLQFIAGQTATTNDIKVSLMQLNYVSGGNSTFGQTLLGNSTLGETVEGGDVMITRAVDNGIELTSTVSAVYDQTVDEPAQANEKVFMAVKTGEELVIRGVLAVAFEEDATSSAYSAEVTAGFIAKDN